MGSLYGNRQYMNSPNKLEIKFQSEAPSTHDHFEGNGHQSTANALKSVIENQPEIHILGLEGELGSGKSTVIKILSSLIPTKYQFITFDVDQYHHSSLKAAFIKVLANELINIVDTNSREDIKKAQDKALGNIFSYKKKTDSQVTPYIFWFGFTFILTARFINNALTNIWDYIKSCLHGNCIVKLDTVTLALAFSPAIVWLFMLWRKNFFKANRSDKNFPSLGNLLKKNTLDTITETLEISKEVGSIELQEAFQAFINSIPENITIILVIDNLDRVESSKVREVWSDLETFTKISNNKLRILLPFSEHHV